MYFLSFFFSLFVLFVPGYCIQYLGGSKRPTHTPHYCCTGYCTVPVPVVSYSLRECYYRTG